MALVRFRPFNFRQDWYLVLASIALLAILIGGAHHVWAKEEQDRTYVTAVKG